MKHKLFAFFFISSLVLFSCSHNVNDTGDDVTITEHVENFSACLKKFNAAFSEEASKMRGMRTRSLEIENNEEYDLYVDSIGNIIISDLLPSSTLLVSEIGLSETDFMEIEKEYGIPSCFMKVYFAMGIMEKETPQTRANAEDVVNCVIWGTGFKEIAEKGAKFALRKCASQVAKKLVPYIGWGWWATETAACLAKL